MSTAKKINNEQALADWLQRSGIDTSGWGLDGTKTIADLWEEIQEEESTLYDNPPRRAVTLVQIYLQRDHLRLTELKQELRSGQTRSRNQPPSEKLHASESPRVAALRCLHEELGLPTDQVDRVHLSAEPRVVKLDSPSYPGLMTEFTIYEAEAEATGLPDEDFWRDNVNAGESDPIVRHCWGWRPPDELRM